MQAAQSDVRRKDKKSANETSMIAERKDLNKWTPNTQREKKKKKQQKKCRT